MPVEVMLTESQNDTTKLVASTPREAIDELAMLIELHELVVIGAKDLRDRLGIVKPPSRNAPARAPSKLQAVNDPGSPTCPDHGTPMRQGNYGWYCATRVGGTDDEPMWCKSKSAA